MVLQLAQQVGVVRQCPARNQQASCPRLTDVSLNWT